MQIKNDGNKAMTKWIDLTDKENGFKALRTVYTDDPSDDPPNQLKSNVPPSNLVKRDISKPWREPKGILTRKTTK